MEWYGNSIAVTVQDLTRSDDGEAVMSRDVYDWNARKENFNVLRLGKGLGSYALIEYHSLPLRFRERFEAKYGDPEKSMRQEQSTLPEDAAAREFFRTYRLPSGESIPEEKQAEYIINARVLNLLRDTLGTQKAMRRACNNNTPIIWSNLFDLAEQLRELYGHTLPKSEGRLRDKLRQYTRVGYGCLVSGKFGNGNTLKITKAAGRQIVALRRSRVPVYTTQQLFDEFNRIAERRGWKPLRSKNALVQYLERPDVKPLWYDAVYGEYAAKQLFARQNKTDMPLVRDALWYGDGTKLNLFYKDYEGGKLVVKTVQVYEVVDAYSEMLLGYHISPTENFDAQWRAFRMAVETAGHKPFEIVTDNQGGQKKEVARQFFASICQVARSAAPYNARAKSIESLFGRFQAQELHKDWRFTGGNISSKEAWKINREMLAANKENLYTYEEMVAAYAKARQAWNAGRHHAAEMSREEMYRTSVNPASVPVSEYDMVEMFWVRTDRPSIFTAAGITITYQKRDYTFEVLNAEGLPDMEWRSRNTGRSFIVRFDPLKMDRALLYAETPMGLRFETEAYPYVTVHRALQEQSEGEMDFIRWNDRANKRERVRRQIENHALEMEYGVAPEQHGLRTPALRGISNAEFERLADTLVVVPSESASQPIEPGEYTKAVSNMDYDPMEIFTRM